MSTGTFERVRDLFQRALDEKTRERGAFVDREAADDAAVRAEVHRLLSAHETSGNAWSSDVVVEALAGLDRDPLVGGRVGALRIEGVLASGGMGVVYSAWDDVLGRSVAVKVLRNALPSASALRKFEAESRILARLRHPGVAAIYSTGAHDIGARRVPYIVMELVDEAKTILEYVRGSGMSVEQRLAMFADVCDAVHHGHQKGIIHLDLKPANILVGKDGTPKVIDFGIARAVDDGDTPAQGATRTGQVVGTLPYMSPEQCGSTDEHGNRLDVDVRTDVYALGVVLYEMLAGRRPVDVDEMTPLEAIDALRGREPARLSEADGSLRGDVETIVHTAIARDRRSRYQSASELAADVRRYLRREPIAARPPTVGYQMWMFAKRHRGLVGTGVGVAVLMAAAIVAVSVALAHSRASQARAEREAANARRATEFFRNTLMSGAPNVVGPERRDPARENGEPTPRQWPHASGRPGSLASLREVALLAASRLNTEFADDPLLRSDVAFDLSQFLQSLDEWVAALPLAREALAVRLRERGVGHSETIRAAGTLATLGQGTEEGREAARLAHEGSVLAYGAGDLRTAAAAVQLGRAMSDREKGLTLARSAIEASRRTSGEGAEDRIRLAHLEVDLAQWLSESENDRGEAMGLLDSVLVRARAGQLSPAMRSVACHLKSRILAGDFGTLVLSGDLQDEALRVAQEALPSGDSWTREMRSAWALSRLRMGDLVAATMSLRSLATDMDAAGLHDTDLALKTRGRLAGALVIQRRDADEAYALATEAAESLARFAGASFNDRIVYFRVIAGAARGIKGEHEGALATIDRELATLDAADPTRGHHWLRCYAQTQRAECFIGMKKFAEAEAALRESDAHVAGMGEQTFWIVSDVHRTWVRLLEATGREEEARRHRAMQPEVMLADHR